ncbi:MAG: hypothetical protein ACRDKX_09355 [Solirubrobacterales bacterium]
MWTPWRRRAGSRLGELLEAVRDADGSIERAAEAARTDEDRERILEHRAMLAVEKIAVEEARRERKG